MRVLECFAGIGGFALAWERLGFEHIQFVEWEPYCQAVLQEHWPEVPIHGDIRSFDAIPFRGRVDVLSGGPPCQPASVAGKRKGSADERWLWPEFIRVARECLPRWIVAENPTGIVTLKPHGLDWICEELEASGYEMLPVVVGADDIGAPHRRKRVWIVARRLDNADTGRCERPDDSLPAGGDKSIGTDGELADGEGSGRQAEGDGRLCGSRAGCDGESGADVAHRDGGGCRDDQGAALLDGERAAFGDGADGRCVAEDVAHAASVGREGSERATLPGWGADPATTGASHRWPSRPGEPQHEWEPPRVVGNPAGLRGHRRDDNGGGSGEGPQPVPELGNPDGDQGRCDRRDAPEPRLVRVPDGLPDRLESRIRRERLKALGNSVVWQVVYEIGKAILAAERQLK